MVPNIRKKIRTGMQGAHLELYSQQRNFSKTCTFYVRRQFEASLCAVLLHPEGVLGHEVQVPSMFQSRKLRRYSARLGDRVKSSKGKRRLASSSALSLTRAFRLNTFLLDYFVELGEHLRGD